MHVLIVSDAYLPSRTSVAILLYELSQTFIEQDVSVDIIVPNPNQEEDLVFHVHDGCRIISVKAFRTKDLGYVRRTLSELLNPWLMWRKLKKDRRFIGGKYSGVIWYSPSIFWGPLIKKLKQQFLCQSYLILRDLFPDWALHLGILRKGPTFFFLKAIERYQYAQANTIGLQSPNNLEYFRKHNSHVKAKIEVLWNWARPLSSIPIKPCSIRIKETILKDRVIFVYTGNIGIAQGLELLLQILEKFKESPDIGFLFVGRGSEMNVLSEFIRIQRIKNALIVDEIDPFEIPSLLSQCHVGLLFLDGRHQTHNIPGKFVTYMQSGLPVLGLVNPGNDLLELILKYQIGAVDDEIDLARISNKIESLSQNEEERRGMGFRSKILATEFFSSKLTVSAILKGLLNQSTSVLTLNSDDLE
jgi:glycosyltransferase involved in cell wall biosynthesis